MKKKWLWIAGGAVVLWYVWKHTSLLGSVG